MSVGYNTTSLFLYGLEVTELNSSIDFKTSAMGSTLQATVELGFYSLGGLLDAIVSAMQSQSPGTEFTATADRTVNNGTENRVTITTDGGYLDLLFATGPRTASTIAPLIGFAVADQTGNTSYTGTSTAGTALISEYAAYNYLSPEQNRMVKGVVNISASGLKESIVFQIQKFIQAQFKYEPVTKVDMEWVDLVDWMIQQREYEFTPETSSPSIFYRVTLEKTSADGKGLGFKWTEQLPQFPLNYDTGILTMRIRE